MRNRWSDSEAAPLSGIELLVYMSRLVGADPALVLWGGGNTSMKREEVDFRNQAAPVLRVKGSGSDLKSVAIRDFPGVRLEDVLPLLNRDSMTDEEMVSYLAHTLMDTDSPRPSIETLLHAFLPALTVLHSHADAIVALSNTAGGADVVRRALGESVALVGYRRPGFLLSKEVAGSAASSGRIQGIVLMNHGLVTWGESVRQAYDRHIDLVSRAEDFASAARQGRRSFGGATVLSLPDEECRRAAASIAPILRGLLSRRQRVILRYDASADVLGFVNSAEAPRLSQIGPATPDHLLNTKRLPVFVRVPDPTNLDQLTIALGDALDTYARDYAAYVERHNEQGAEQLPAEPRVMLVSGLGMWTAGRDAHSAAVTAEIYHHTIAVMSGAEAVDTYASLDEVDAYQAEYWPLELFKLTLQPAERPLARRIAIVTGAASGIGRAIAARFASEGAHIILLDQDRARVEEVASVMTREYGEGRCLGLHVDVTSPGDVKQAIEQASLVYGGLDIVVSNAGIAPSGSLTEMDLRDWDRSLAVNATGHFLVAREAMRVMQRQGAGGSLIFIASKNVTAPGADFGAYSAAKAAEAQLARIAAIEGGGHGIRANIINPDAIFEGSMLFSSELRDQRARAHGVAPAQLEEFYRQRNLLKTRVLAEDVAEAALFFASDRFAKTTGAMLPVDGGVREAFPR
ncbi:MAG: bifunctional rhamnulose-1-phosphate aldolase/short-chain dehydrogenase [Dehalococcoidia bacterium]